MQKIVIVDYGMANLRSVQKAFERLGHAAEISGDPQRVSEADKVVQRAEPMPLPQSPPSPPPASNTVRIGPPAQVVAASAAVAAAAVRKRWMSPATWSSSRDTGRAATVSTCIAARWAQPRMRRTF